MVNKDNKNIIDQLNAEIFCKKREWKRLRSERLGLRDRLFSSGCSKQDVRKHGAYKKLKKEQHQYSVRIVHLERKLYKKIRSMD